MSEMLPQRLEFAVNSASASSRLTLDYFCSTNLDESTKLDGSPVTAGDRACELDLRARIARAYPDDSILGEEFERTIGTSGYEWVIDPIDGTISFVQGVPFFGTMLACMHDGNPVLGVIVMPALNETVYAGDGLGCWHVTPGNGARRVRVSDVAQVDQALINTTSMSYFQTHEHRRLYDHLDARCKHTRGWSDCYGWVLLATGRVDAVIEPVLSLWDFAAAIPIIVEAGGNWNDMHGDQLLESGEMIAANPSLLAEINELISGTSS